MTHTTKFAAAQAATFTSNTMLSLREVCELTGKPGKPRDRKTVAKGIQAGRYPNAVQATVGRQEWTVPVRDLVDAGDLDPSQIIEVAATLEALRESRQIASDPEASARADRAQLPF